LIGPLTLFRYGEDQVEVLGVQQFGLDCNNCLSE